LSHIKREVLQYETGTLSVVDPRWFQRSASGERSLTVDKNNNNNMIIISHKSWYTYSISKKGKKEVACYKMKQR
jgi:hypothetical protein